MAGKQASYRQIIKATSIFGGVQVFNIIIALIRSKCIAVLLGPAGMGISGLLLSTTGIIGSITNLGLGSSAIRNVSLAAATENKEKVSTTVSIIRRLVWITGAIGTLITLFLSPFLSELTFGNKSYSIAFMCISITLLLSQLSTGQFVILQGLRELKYLAKADVAGMLAGLFISIPIYYRFGVGGIVPAIVVSSVVSFSISYFFASKIRLPKVVVVKSTFISESKEMLKMGFLFSFSGLISVVSAYFLKVFIGRHGGFEQVGLYNAGFAIINTYVGMIFAAMITDYYPRLAGVASDNNEAKVVINQQAETAILIIAPVLIAFLLFIDWVVILLYSHKFVAITGMLQWAALGMFFKTASWAIGILFPAKGSSKLFFWNELVVNIYLLIFNIVGYSLWGLDGLGISFFVGYVLFFLQVFFVANKYYSLKLEWPFCKIFTIQFFLGVMSFLFIEKVKMPQASSIGAIFFILSIYYSFYELNKRLGLNTLLLDLRSKFKEHIVKYLNAVGNK